MPSRYSEAAMTTNSRDLQRVTKRAALVGVLALIAAGSPAAGSAASPSASASGGAPKFHVTGLGVVDRAAQNGSFVVDERGGEHSVTLHTTSDGITDHLVYRTRAPGAHRWTRTTVGSYEDDPFTDHGVTAFLSTDGKRLEVLVTTCRIIVATQAPIGGTRLRFPRRVSSVNCEDDDGGPGPEPVGAVALPHHRAEVLYDNGTLMTGTPGRRFAKAPTVRGLAQPFELLRDAETNQLWLVGYRDINGVLSLTMWSRRPAGSWGGPQPVPCAVCGARGEGGPLSVAVNNGRMAMAEESRRGPIRIARRTSAGHWRAPVRFPLGSSGKDEGEMTLAYNPESGHLHAVWLSGSASSAIFTEKFVSGHWTHPLRLARAGLVESVTFGPSGATLVGYTTF
jgi:hypothetical protein